jgi:hypothetical protein
MNRETRNKVSRWASYCLSGTNTLAYLAGKQMTTQRVLQRRLTGSLGRKYSHADQGQAVGALKKPPRGK